MSAGRPKDTHTTAPNGGPSPHPPYVETTIIARRHPP